MFLFYHSEQTSENVSYHKGKLFEGLLRAFLEKLGFDVELRQKRNSLEYDLSGRSRLGNNEIIGEAKAHDKPISGSDFSSFVGKLFPLFSKNQNLLGLYLSTSSLTADADDYHRSLSDTALKLEVNTGERLMTRISAELGLPRPETLTTATKDLGVYPLSQHFLMTDVGPFLVQIAADKNGATPAWFAVMRQDGRVVDEREFLSTIQSAIPELRELQPIYKKTTNPVRDSARKEIPEGLIVGTDWADYRLPTSPEVFVGRRSVVDKLTTRILENSSAPVIQVKSRSGVGKSSLMAFISNRLRETDAGKVALYDVRSIKSIFDLWSVVQHFTEASRPAVDLGEMEQQLQGLDSTRRRFILMFDQFESTFANPDLYDAYESIAITALRCRPWLTVIFARKSDLLTTYDNSRISLEHLNEISESIALEDFNAQEAVTLIDSISSHAGKRISADIKSYVLEFAQGFPWLLKRTMAHILRLLSSGVQQAELIPSAMRLDDLFDEELEELDEIERDYLVRIAQRLPATYQDLDRAFEEDKHLPEVLDKLTRYRLFRLSGSTYDTYNDVFKEYLVYKKLPDFRLSFMYRLGPASVMKPFRQVTDLNEFTTEEVGIELGLAQGSTFNLIREFRNLGLIDKDGERWRIPEAVVDSYGRGRLGEYIRQQMVKNGIISDLLTQVQSRGPLLSDGLAKFLEERFPFTIATPKTWNNYANNLKRWLKVVRLLEERAGYLAIPQADRGAIAKEIGNLRLNFQARGVGLHFLPGANWSNVELFFNKAKESGAPNLTVKQKDALRSLVDIGICTDDGEILVKTLEDLKAAAKRAIEDEPYRKFWRTFAEGGDLDALLKEEFGLAPLQPSTIDWRKKLLINWGRALGLVGSKGNRRRRAAIGVESLPFIAVT